MSRTIMGYSSFAMETVTLIAQTIQLAVAPVFLLAGIGAFLNVCAGRLARVIDRARVVEKLVLQTVGEEHDRLVDEIRKLDRRMSVVNGSIFLSVASAIAICTLVMLLFSAQLFGVHMATAVALLFIAAMMLMIIALCTFLVEIRLASRTIHIRSEVLYHQVAE
ncbi:hypothetical protein HNQ99_001391 [Rhizorhapis suberifaciens]|uniref:DUF2721 domain-containing protein n=2 Tax=Rhizorhapis suberifaciens TaxID=13656 RepID=A0A840HU06_9SPHN|nr:hypothetical protein [Rhizorhapis suberifaciens]